MLGTMYCAPAKFPEYKVLPVQSRPLAIYRSRCAPWQVFGTPWQLLRRRNGGVLTERRLSDRSVPPQSTGDLRALLGSMKPYALRASPIAALACFISVFVGAETVPPVASSWSARVIGVNSLLRLPGESLSPREAGSVPAAAGNAGSKPAACCLINGERLSRSLRRSHRLFAATVSAMSVRTDDASADPSAGRQTTRDR